MSIPLRCAALLLAAQPLSALQAADPARPPPTLSEAPALERPASAASAPAPLQRRRMAPSQELKVRVSEDALVRVEEHLNARGHVTRVVVYPKNGSLPYEMEPPRLYEEHAQVGPRRWKLLDF